jgi:hypothetical protein
MILEAFLPGVLLFLEAYRFLESSRSRFWRTLFLDVVKVLIVRGWMWFVEK